MGGLLSYFWGAISSEALQDLDTPDEKTGLTGRERQEISDTWSLVKKDAKGNGIELFIRYFTKHPEYQARFAAFSTVPIDQLRGNRKLMAHALSVIYALTSVVDNLGDVDCLLEVLNLQGTNHRRRGIPEKAFQDLKPVVLQLLQDKLGAALSKRGLVAWDKALDLVNRVMFQGMPDAREKQ